MTLPPAPSPLPPGPLRCHSLRIHGTAHVAVTGTAAERVVAQAPVARLGERRLLGPQTDPLATHQDSNDGSAPALASPTCLLARTGPSALSTPVGPGHHPCTLALRPSAEPRPRPSGAPGSGCSRVRSPGACRNRFHSWGHTGCPQAPCPGHRTDTLQGKETRQRSGELGSTVFRGSRVRGQGLRSA